MNVRPADPHPPWFWVAFCVGLAAGVCSIAVGWLLAWAGNRLDACRGELGCFGAFAIGLFGAPFAAVSAALAGGVTARRAAREPAAAEAAIWKRSLGAGFLAAIVGAFVGALALGIVSG